MFVSNPEMLFNNIGVNIILITLIKIFYEPLSFGIFDNLFLGYGTYLIYKNTNWNKEEKTIQVINMLNYEVQENNTPKQIEKKQQNTISTKKKLCNPFFMEYPVEHDDILVTNLDLRNTDKDNHGSSVNLPLFLKMAVNTPLPESPKFNCFVDEDFE